MSPSPAGERAEDLQAGHCPGGHRLHRPAAGTAVGQDPGNSWDYCCICRCWQNLWQMLTDIMTDIDRSYGRYWWTLWQMVAEVMRDIGWSYDRGWQKLWQRMTEVMTYVDWSYKINAELERLYLKMSCDISIYLFQCIVRNLGLLLWIENKSFSKMHYRICRHWLLFRMLQ